MRNTAPGFMQCDSCRHEALTLRWSEGGWRCDPCILAAAPVIIQPEITEFESGTQVLDLMRIRDTLDAAGIVATDDIAMDVRVLADVAGLLLRESTRGVPAPVSFSVGDECDGGAE